MLNKQKQIEQISRQLSPIEADEQILSGLFDQWYASALAKSNRKPGEEPPALLAIVRDTVTAAYNRRGNEGTASYSMGGQSETYEDLEERMFQAILKSNLRVMKL